MYAAQAQSGTLPEVHGEKGNLLAGPRGLEIKGDKCEFLASTPASP